MRYALVLAIGLLACPRVVEAAEPPITFQSQPINRVLDDFRAAAGLIGGEKAVKGFNEAIKERLGEKGFQGLDLSRPIVGYVVLAPKPEDITAVIAFPAAAEKDFLDFCDRALGIDSRDLKNGMYALPAIDPRYKTRLRFSERYGYIAYGFNPEPALDPKAIVPVNKLLDPADQALFSAKLHFNRIPLPVMLAMPKYIEEIKKELDLENADPQVARVVKAMLPGIEKMLGRYALLMGGADVAKLAINLDVPSGDLSVEATLNGKPDTALAKEIAARKPTANNFGSLITPDTVAGFQTRLPFFNDELRDSAAKGFEEISKVADPPQDIKGVVDELFKGFARTAKTGEFDVVGAIRGPNNAGEFELVAAIAFDDPTAFEKEFRKFMNNQFPVIKWDADKLEKINIHTYKFEAENIVPAGRVFGGANCTLAFAFAPKGAFLAIGPDAVKTLKAAMVVKPTPEPVLDVVLNPARLKKFMEKANRDGKADDIEKVFGKEDKLQSAMSLKVETGKQLSVKYTINLRMLPRAIAVDEVKTEEKPLVEKK